MFLYSTNCWLAYLLGEEYYGGTHFVWCSRYFDPMRRPGTLGRTPPPTSSPKDIFTALAKEVHGVDRHGFKIQSLRDGLARGAAIRRDNKEVTLQKYQEIIEVIGAAEIVDFTPLLYVIDARATQDRLEAVPTAQKAHPLSDEYKIARLHSREFDVLDLT